MQSVPFILGLQLSAPTRWQAGALVAFRSRVLPPYYSAGTRFTKAVAGVPGDRVIRLGRDFYLNGRAIASARTTDSQGRPAHVFTPPLLPRSLCHQSLITERSCHESVASLVPDNALFVLGTHARSFDSRYWGFVTEQEVLGRVVALF